MRNVDSPGLGRISINASAGSNPWRRICDSNTNLSDGKLLASHRILYRRTFLALFLFVDVVVVVTAVDVVVVVVVVVDVEVVEAFSGR